MTATTGDEGPMHAKQFSYDFSVYIVVYSRRDRKRVVVNTSRNEIVLCRGNAKTNEKKSTNVRLPFQFVFAEEGVLLDDYAYK